jgi:hypothetical protein
MQDKYKELFNDFIGVLETKAGSRDAALEIFGEMGLPVVIGATATMLKKVQDNQLKTKVTKLFNDGKDEDAYKVLHEHGIDTKQILKDTFMDMFSDIIKL